MSVAHSALPMYNAALNKLAYQSSVWVDYGSYNASLANDGNHETHVWKNNKTWCSSSQRETNPWWAVDLGLPTTIYRVDLTNRGDQPGMYLFSVKFHKVKLLFSSVHSVHSVVEVSDIILSYCVCHFCAEEISEKSFGAT